MVEAEEGSGAGIGAGGAPAGEGRVGRGVRRGGRQLVAAWERWGKGDRTGTEHAAASVVEDDRNSVEFLCHPQSINHFFGDNM